MGIKQLIIHNNLSQMKNKILPTCLQANYRDSLGEFSNTEYGVLGLRAFGAVSRHDYCSEKTLK